MSQNIETLLKEERNIIVKAYNRDVINKKQNWAIADGEKYYNLHYKGDNKEEYNSDKEDQVGETDRKIKIDPDKVIKVKPKLMNDDYLFETGV
jgi:hypothetical protein